MNKVLGTFRTDAEKWKAVQEKAKANGTNASALLNDFLGKYLDDCIDRPLEPSPAVGSDELKDKLDEILSEVRGFGGKGRSAVNEEESSSPSSESAAEILEQWLDWGGTIGEMQDAIDEALLDESISRQAKEQAEEERRKYEEQLRAEERREQQRRAEEQRRQAAEERLRQAEEHLREQQRRVEEQQRRAQAKDWNNIFESIFDFPFGLQIDPKVAAARELLGVAPTATEAEIKSAYRALARKHHPDAGGDTAKIQEINAAYELLTKLQTA
jgi:DnaJ-domain-containing protein 1